MEIAVPDIKRKIKVIPMKQLNKQEAGISFLKGVIGAIPYAGTLLNEIIFDYRSRLKEKRLVGFVEELEKELSKYDETKIDFEYLKTDEFSDILEEILKKVVTSNSDEKIKRFKKILIGEMTASNNTEFKLTFLDITSKITETQILILKEHNSIGRSISKYYKDIESLNRDIPELEKGLRTEKQLAAKGYANNTTLFEKRLKQMKLELNKKLKATKQVESKRSYTHYGISLEEFLIQIQDLISKGLLVDAGAGISYLNPFQVLDITKLAKGYLKYIIEE